MRFRQLFRETERDVLAYVLRRVRRPDDAPDVVAETYLVAWRKIEEVPPGDEARLWLIGVARRQLANATRGHVRRQRLADRMRDELSRLPFDADSSGPDSDPDLDEALARLPEEDREVLTLFAWEGLKPNEIATVLGIRGVTARSRLHRAKKRLREQLGAPR